MCAAAAVMFCVQVMSICFNVNVCVEIGQRMNSNFPHARVLCVVLNAPKYCVIHTTYSTREKSLWKEVTHICVNITHTTYDDDDDADADCLYIYR